MKITSRTEHGPLADGMADRQWAEGFTDRHTADVGAGWRKLLRRPIGSKLCDNWSAAPLAMRMRVDTKSIDDDRTMRL